MIQPLGDRRPCSMPVNQSGGCLPQTLLFKLFHQLGGFDENYPKAANEDQDLYLRLRITSIPFVRSKSFSPCKDFKYYTNIMQTIWKSQSWAYYCNKHRFGYFNGRSFITPREKLLCINFEIW